MNKPLATLIREAQAAWDRNDGFTYTKLRAEISRIEKTAFSSLS